MTWSEKLKMLVEKYGQANLALFFGVSQPTISYWLNGLRKPRLFYIEKIMRTK